VWSCLNNYVQRQQPKIKVGLEQRIDDAIPQKVIQSYILHILTVMQEVVNTEIDLVVFMYITNSSINS